MRITKPPISQISFCKINITTFEVEIIKQIIKYNQQEFTLFELYGSTSQKNKNSEDNNQSNIINEDNPECVIC